MVDGSGHPAPRDAESRSDPNDTLRQITMDLLYRQGGMTNSEIGRLFGVDYSAVSQERRRLRARIEKDRKIRSQLRIIESNISRIEK